MNRLKFEDLVEIFGRDRVVNIINNPEREYDFSNRVDADLDCSNLVEFSAEIGELDSMIDRDEISKGEIYQIIGYVCFDNDRVEEVDCLSDLDWDNADYEYEINFTGDSI